MNSKKLIGAMAILLSLTDLAFAQRALEAQFTGQPLIYAKDGSLNGCGVRVVAVDAPTSVGEPTLAFDASLQFDIRLQGVLVKVIASRIQVVNGAVAVSGDRPVVEHAWFRTDGFAPTTPENGKVQQTLEPPGGVIYRTKATASDTQTLLAMANGKVIELGAKLQGDSSETVRFGAVALSKAEQQRVRSCMNDLLAKLKK